MKSWPGVFSLYFDGLHGWAVGGDYRKPDAAERTGDMTENGGQTWRTLPGLSGWLGRKFVGGGWSEWFGFVERRRR